LNIPLLPPDINKSNVLFHVENTAEGGAVRYALAAIKNVGKGTMEMVVSDREANGVYKDIPDLTNRLDTKSINKRQVENLIRSGALDPLNDNRKQTYEGVEAIIRHAGAAQQERESDQIGLFGAEGRVVAGISLPETPDWLETDRLKEEFDAIGFYLSAHPLDSYSNVLERLKIKSFAAVEAAGETLPVKLAGMVISKKERTSTKGNKYAFVQLSDSSSAYEITIFQELLMATREILKPGNKVLINASVQFGDQGLKLLANQIRSLDTVTADSSTCLKIYIDEPTPLASVKEILEREKDGNGGGLGEVMLVSRFDMNTEAEIKVPGKFKVSPVLAQAIKAVPGVIEVREV
jgi:DNA polymerase-3 subunit alpha